MNINNNDKVVHPQTILTLDDDFSLIHKFNQGDEFAFKTLVLRHKEKVRNIVYLTFGNAEHVDDISQEVFITVFRKLETFKFQSQFTTWLYRITVNKCKDQLRRIKIRSVLSPFDNDDENNISLSVITKDDFDIRELVQKSIAKLPEKLRTPLVLKDYEGMSYQEIAETLKTEVGTVKSRIFRAREGLKKMLEPFKEEIL
jgi:RNA polymerase sigma-70 factor (ECF subfamily)